MKELGNLFAFFFSVSRKEVIDNIFLMGIWDNFLENDALKNAILLFISDYDNIYEYTKNVYQNPGWTHLIAEKTKF